MMTKALSQLTAVAVLGLLVALSLCLLDIHGHSADMLDLCLLFVAILVVQSLSFTIGPYWLPLPVLLVDDIGLVPGRRSPAPI